MSQWHYTSAGERRGPVSGEELKALAACGKLGPFDLVWNPTLPEWITAGRVGGLIFGTGENGADPGSPSSPPAAEAGLPPADFLDEKPAPQVQNAQGPIPVAQPAIPLAYAAPGAPEFSAPAPAPGFSRPADPIMNYRTRHLFRETAPWARIASIMMFVYAGLAGLTAVAGIGMSMGVIGRSIGSRSERACFETLIQLVSAVVSLVMGILLNQYASRIRRLLATNQSSDLEAALAAQKSYFIFIGILSLVIMCLLGLALVVVGIMFLSRL